MKNLQSEKVQKYDWLLDERYQTVLKATHTIAYEYNPHTKEQTVSPFINELIAGNYDGRLLSHVMVEDNIIHPNDLEKSLRFRKEVAAGTASEMTLRLRTPEGPYHWFKMGLFPYTDGSSFSYLGTITDVDKEVRQREALRYRANYDLTTGIYHQAAFFRETEHRMRAEPDILRCIIRFDIDCFKIINETYSLSEGDRVLRYTANLLREMTFANETYAHSSNDIFFVCLARSKKGTLDFLSDLEQHLNLYPIDFQFVLSSGIVCIPHYNGEAINTLCDWAAIAQRTVKGNYISHYAFYQDSMLDKLSREHYITKNMKSALRNHQFQLYLQPKYNMENHSIIGAEALSRWIHPNEGMISPGDFIPLFEKNGFIVRLDEYMWELTCQTLRRWLDAGYHPVPISVNVSRVHLSDPDLCDKLIHLVEKYELPPHLLELEITESAYTENSTVLYDTMDELQKSGFIFSMDDFGSGYSSLNSLKDIPVNLVKIDLNFLKKARKGMETGRNILKGTIQLIHGIHLPVIAEGIETKEQADFLINVGCIQGQGYYYAKPMPVEEFEQLLITGQCD